MYKGLGWAHKGGLYPGRWGYGWARIRVWGGWLIKGACIIRGVYKGLGWAHKGGLYPGGV